MQNPFSSFLTPPSQHSPLAGAAEFSLALAERQRQRGLDQQRALENSQQHALAQRGASRADAQMKLQQDDQAHRFTAEEQKQVEGLLAEYQDAEDQGDEVRLSRASQMLKRFGMDVGQKQDGQRPPPLPGQLLPQVATKDPRAQAFTGAAEEPDLSQEEFERRLIGDDKNPVDKATADELAFRDKLRADNATPEPDIAGHLASVGPLKPLKLNAPKQETSADSSETTKLDPQQEAQFQAWAQSNGISDVDDPRSHYDYRGFFLETGGAPHRQGDHFPDTYKQHGHETFSEESRYSKGPGDGGKWNGEQFQPAVIDLDKDDPAPLQVGQLPKVATAPQAPDAQPPPRLPGQLLPTVVSKGGKQLYESTGPSGRWAPMVSGVFQSFTQHENPEMAAAAKRAQSMASSLISVDGIAPKEAIKSGMDYLQGEANRISQTERTKIGSRPRLGGGGGGVPGKFQALGPKEDRAESIKGYITESRGAVGKLNESDRLLAQAEALANSNDPALQRNAIDVLVQSRSGATVSDRERARYDQLDGVLSQAQNYVARWSGGPLDPQYVNKIKMVIAEQRRINASTREEVAADLEEAYAAQNEGKVDQPILERRRKALGKTIRRDTSSEGAAPSGDPNADLY